MAVPSLLLRKSDLLLAADPFGNDFFPIELVLFLLIVVLIFFIAYSQVQQWGWPRVIRTFNLFVYDVKIRRQLQKLAAFRDRQHQQVQHLRLMIDNTRDKLYNAEYARADVQEAVKAKISDWEGKKEAMYGLVDRSETLIQRLIGFRNELHLLHYVINQMETEPNPIHERQRFHDLEQEVRALIRDNLLEELIVQLAPPGIDHPADRDWGDKGGLL